MGPLMNSTENKNRAKSEVLGRAKTVAKAKTQMVVIATDGARVCITLVKAYRIFALNSRAKIIKNETVVNQR